MSITSGSTSSGPVRPLTTVFTPPSDCRSFTWTGLVYTSTLHTDIWHDFNYRVGSRASCYPSDFTIESIRYSPGLLCPQGQTGIPAYAASAVDLAATPEHEFSMKCCWPPYTELVYGWACGITFTTTTSVSIIYNNDERRYSTWSTYTTYVMTDTTMHAMHNGPMLLYKSSDVPASLRSQLLVARSEVVNLPAQVTTSSSSSVRTSSSAVTSSSVTGTIIQGSSAGNTTPASSTGLSTGAKAGIGAGAALGVLLLIVLGAFIIFRRRKRPSNAGNASELHAVPGHFGQPTEAEKDGNTLYEAEAKHIANTRAAQYPAHEMGANAPWDGNSGGYPSHQELSAAALADARSQPPEHYDHETPPSQRTPLNHEISNIDRRALAARELEWLEQEEARIKRQRELLMAQRMEHSTLSR